MDSTIVGPLAWRVIDSYPNWYVLLDHATGYRTPRLVLSDQDEFFLREAVKHEFPRDELKTVADGKQKLLVRKPAE